MDTHGIILRSLKVATVSCQCLASETKHVRTKGGGEYYEPMKMLPNETVFQTYNRPENHLVTFTDKDKIKT